MGIDAKCLVFLSQMCRTRPLERCVTLGRQQIFIEPHLLAWASTISKIPRHVLNRHNGAFAEGLLIEYFGAVEVVSIDAFNDDQPTVLHDLNVPVPDELERKFDSVLDIGTSEHVFSTKSVFGNIKNLCKVGGFILHYVPGNNMCGHGLYQFSPTLFQSIYSEELRRGTAKIMVNFQARETRFFKINFVPEERVNIFFGGKMNMFVFAVNELGVIEDKAVQQMDYLVSSNDEVGMNIFMEKSKPRSWLFLKLREIPLLKIAVYYVRSCRWHSWIVGWIAFRKYSECVDLAEEVF